MVRLFLDEFLQVMIGLILIIYSPETNMTNSSSMLLVIQSYTDLANPVLFVERADFQRSLMLQTL